MKKCQITLARKVTAKFGILKSKKVTSSMVFIEWLVKLPFFKAILLFVRFLNDRIFINQHLILFIKLLMIALALTKTIS